MNKTYFAPTLRVSMVQAEGLIALSTGEGYATENEVLVKEEITSSPSASSYNVWNDDWSN